MRIVYGRISKQAARLVMRHIKRTAPSMRRVLVQIEARQIHNERVQQCNRASLVCQ